MQGQGYPYRGIWGTPPEGKPAVRGHRTDGMSGTPAWLLQNARETASGFSLDLESRITAGSAIPYSNRYGGSV